MLLLCALVAGIGSMWATEYDFEFSSTTGSYNSTNKTSTWTDDYCTIFQQKGSSTTEVADYVNAPRWYKSHTITFTPAEGYEISQIVVVGSSSGKTTYYGQTMTASKGTITNTNTSTTTWTGTATHDEGVTLTMGSQCRPATVSITYSATVAPGTVATPTFSPAAGAVAYNTSVSISCATDGATIYYTTDGSTPTTSSSVYDAEAKPTIIAATTIKAYAVKDGLTDSDVAEGEYTIAQVATPTFSPGAGEVDKDAEITINCATDGATIYYTTDGSTPTTSSTVYDSDAKPTIDDDKTIKAIAIKDNYLNSDVSEAAYTYSRQKDYNLVTSLSQIVSGKHYLIASGTSGSGVKVMDGQNDNNRGVKSVSFSGSTLQATGAQEFVIQGPDKDGYYTFYDASLEGFLYASSSSKNYLKTQTTLNDNGRFTITFSENAAVITAQGTNTHNLMRYNSSNSIFSCYESGQSAIYLFVLNGEATPSESVTVTSVGYATYASDNALDFTGKSIEAYYATQNGTNGVNFTRIYKVPAREGVLLHNPSGATTLDIPVATAKDNVPGNVFKRGTGVAVASDVETTKHNYILNNGASGLGFYHAAGQTVAVNKAYIQINEGAGVKGFIALPGSEETAVEAVKAETEDGVIFNLAGQRVQKLQRGINIINGKKVVVK